MYAKNWNTDETIWVDYNTLKMINECHKLRCCDQCKYDHGECSEFFEKTKSLPSDYYTPKLANYKEPLSTRIINFLAGILLVGTLIFIVLMIVCLLVVLIGV